MRIHGERLTKLAAEKGLTPERLGEVVARTGLQGDRAVSAVKNWMRGNDHPRCKGEDLNKLASALGCEPSRIGKFTCNLKYHKGSPRKAKLLVDLIRGKDFDTATNLLTFTTKRAAVNVRKALMAAFADAQQANADTNSLIVMASTADDGPRIKRFKEKDRGRAHRILKRMSHISISLVEKN